MAVTAERQEQVEHIWRDSFQTELNDALRTELREAALVGVRLIACLQTTKYEKEIINIGISLSGRFIMTAYTDTTINVWDIKGELLSSINANNMANSYAAVSPCGRFVAAAGACHSLVIRHCVF